jgi:type IV secretory pathway TrbL component
MRIKAIARDFKAFVKDLLWLFVIIVTLPITIPLAWWAIRQDDKEDSNEAK